MDGQEGKTIIELIQKEEKDEEEDEEEEEEELAPRFIPKSERILLHKKEQDKKTNNNNKENNNNKKNENKKVINKEKTENDNDKNKKEKNDSKEKNKDKNKTNKEDKEAKANKEKTEKEKENDILKDNILSIRNSLDKIHQQNIKYLIELEKKKNEAKKHNIIELDEDENDNKIGKPKKLKSQQEKIYIHLPDDTDDQNDINEYNNWKERELKRIKRDIEKYESYIKEQEEIKKRRLMSETEIKEDNIRLGADSTKNRFRSKISFLQKYYHKGVFFQDEAEGDPNHVYNRDFNLPTWEDTVDKSNLPKMLAKRRGNAFKKSQSKYLHLNDADTTSFDKNFIVPENILAKIQKISKKK